MNVLMFSSDRNIFVEGSDVRQRMTWYGSLFSELHIVVLLRSGASSRMPFQIANNVYVYPAVNRFGVGRLLNGYALSKNLLRRDTTFNNWIISAQDPFEIGLLGFLLKRKFKIPLQLQIHTDFLSPYFWRESLKNKIRVLLARFLLPRADGIRVVSERIKNSLIINHLSFPAKIIVLPVFINIEGIRAIVIATDIHKKYSQFDFIILMASRLTREKNIGMAISALQSLIRTNRRIGLIIVGDGPELKTLKLQTANHKLQTNIIFESSVDFETLISYYKTADLFLLTSNYEGYGRTIVEALAAGCPVVMTDVGVAGEIVKDEMNGRIIQTGDTTSLVSVLTNKVNGTKIIKEKNTFNYRFSKDDYLTSFASAFTEILLKSSRKKLCYVLPAFKNDDATHFAHIHDLLRRLSEYFDIYLIIERGEMPSEEFNMSQIVLAKNKFFVFCALFLARTRGYKDFYVHYSFFSAFFASLISRISHGRVYYWNCGEPWKFKRNTTRELFERAVYHFVSVIVTGTDNLADKYSDVYGINKAKIAVIPNWIDTNRFNVNFGGTSITKKRLGITENIPIVLFVHRLSPRKGSDLIIPIAKFLKRKTNFCLLIIGSGPDEKKIREEATSNGLESEIKILGAVPNKELPKYFALSDAFLMPSYEEGFPRVLLETMALGLPFVVSNVGGVKKIIPPEMKPFLISERNPENFADTLYEIIILPKDKRVALANELRKWVSRYSVEAVVDKLRVLIK